MISFSKIHFREKPQDEDWCALVSLKCPLLLNFAQCKLLKQDYYAVIEHCSEVLKHEPSKSKGISWVYFVFNHRILISDNVKALYRRAKAHVGAWNPDEAKNDYVKCQELDKTLVTKINRELDDLNQQIHVQDIDDKLKYQKLFQ